MDRNVARTDRADTHLNAVKDALKRYRVTNGSGFGLGDHATDDLPPDLAKHESKMLLKDGIKRLSVLQERLYASGTWSLLIVFQAMDAGGKDSTIKHVMSGVNPQGVAVTSFKAPGPTELSHDFLWRISNALPARGMIGIFNRSYYEDVLVARVHKDILASSHLPTSLMKSEHFWTQRIADIAAFEGYLGRQGTRVIKFFLNVSRGEQKKRFLKRLETPEKRWKFAASDLKERGYWADYQDVYQAAIAGTATTDAPWYVIPADRKWYTRLVVAEAIIKELEALHLHTPRVTHEAADTLEKARLALESE